MTAVGRVPSGPVGATDSCPHPQTTPHTDPTEFTLLSNKATTRVKPNRSHTLGLRLAKPGVSCVTQGKSSAGDEAGTE